MTSTTLGKKMISLGVIIIGLLGLIVSAVWDDIITGNQTAKSIGTYQYAGIAIGIIIAIIGAAILLVNSAKTEAKYEQKAPQAETTTICNFCGTETKSPQVFTKDGKHYWWCGKCSAGFPHKEEAIERLAELEVRRKAEEEKERKRLAELEARGKAEEEVRTKLDAELEARRKAKEEERKKAKEEKQKKSTQLKEELEAMQENIPNIFLDDIKAQLSKGDFDKAEQLLAERRRDYERYLELGRSLKDIEEEITMLSRRLAKGELTSDAYERASDALERKKKDIDEELWKIQRKIFREKYEKPF